MKPTQDNSRGGIFLPIHRRLAAKSLANSRPLTSVGGRFLWLDQKERFLDNVEPIPFSGCHLWKGTVARNGYGRFWVKGIRKMAHRVSWEMENGIIPSGLVINHKCRVRNCVNVKHLEVIDFRTNVLIGIGPTAVNYKKQNCPKCKAGYSIDLRGHRICLACIKKRKRIKHKIKKFFQYRERCGWLPGPALPPRPVN